MKKILHQNTTYTNQSSCLLKLLDFLQIIKSGVDIIFAKIFPYSCIHCGEILEKGSEDIFFCEKCSKKIIPINQNECCRKCGYPLEKENFLDDKKQCYSCSILHPQFQVARSCFQYKGIIRHLLLLLKYHFFTDCISFIGEEMYKTYIENIKNGSFVKPDFVCFVPITKRKLFFKTFNHSAIITNAFINVANKNGQKLPVIYDFLIKTHKTKQSKKLNQKERIASRHFISVNQKYLHLDLKGKTILLIDDIITTGATINETTILINQVFPRVKVECLSFARTMVY